MSLLDGRYSHEGASLVWDDDGVTLARFGEQTVVHASWSEIFSVRRVGKAPGCIQLMVHGHVPPSDPRQDPFSISVASESDAYRLLTSFSWNTGASGRPISLGLIDAWSPDAEKSPA